MTKIVCDLCGKEVPAKMGFGLEIFGNEKLSKERSVPMIMPGMPLSEDDDAMQEYDLCDDCKAALADFMKGRKKDEEEQG